MRISIKILLSILRIMITSFMSFLNFNKVYRKSNNKDNKNLDINMIKIDNLPEIFTKAMPVLQILENAGFEAYFVGGSVRDVLLHRHVHDVDITTSAYPEEVKELFDKSIDTGIKHGTVTVLYGGESYEITTFRTESGYQDFRRPDHVTF